MAHQRAYQRNLDYLIQNTNVEDLMSKLYTGMCIRQRDYEQLRRKLHQEGPSSATDLLFGEVLMRNPSADHFKKLLECLRNSQQDVLARRLQRDWEEELRKEEMRREPLRGTSMEQPQVNHPSERPVSTYSLQETSPQYQSAVVEPRYTMYGFPQHQTPLQASPSVPNLHQPQTDDHQYSVIQSNVSPTSENAQVSYPTSQDPQRHLEAVKQKVIEAGLEATPKGNQVAMAAGNGVDGMKSDMEKLDLAAGNTIPRVDIKELNLDKNNTIGRGGFGTVYKSNWKGTDVAVKEIPMSFRKKTKARDMSTITKEVNISGMLRHPNIVQIMAYSFDKSGVFLVYELLNGYNLDQILFGTEAEGTALETLNYQCRVYIAKQICQAIAYLHGLNPMVIHGDIKPSNIIVTENGHLTKLCDLGLCKLKAKNAHTTTGGNVAAGTPMYMAPEQLLSGKSSTVRSDIYALGATLLELFTETDMWDEQIENEHKLKLIKDSMLKGTPTPTLDMLEDEVLKSVIAKCISYREQERLTAMELLTCVMSLSQAKMSTS